MVRYEDAPAMTYPRAGESSESIQVSSRNPGRRGKRPYITECHCSSHLCRAGQAILLVLRVPWLHSRTKRSTARGDLLLDLSTGRCQMSTGSSFRVRQSHPQMPLNLFLVSQTLRCHQQVSSSMLAATSPSAFNLELKAHIRPRIALL